jgi:hypothetical protein
LEKSKVIAFASVLLRVALQDSSALALAAALGDVSLRRMTRSKGKHVLLAGKLRNNTHISLQHHDARLHVQLLLESRRRRRNVIICFVRLHVHPQ